MKGITIYFNPSACPDDSDNAPDHVVGDDACEDTTPKDSSPDRENRAVPYIGPAVAVHITALLSLPLLRGGAGNLGTLNRSVLRNPCGGT
jgi:hypothetical protein